MSEIGPSGVGASTEAQRSVGEADGHVDDQVGAAPLVDGRARDPRNDPEIARRTAVAALLASALQADRVPSSPAGILTWKVFCARSRPLPRQVLQGFSITVPLPRRRGQGCESEKSPCESETTPAAAALGADDRRGARLAPVPPHV